MELYRYIYTFSSSIHVHNFFLKDLLSDLFSRYLEQVEHIEPKKLSNKNVKKTVVRCGREALKLIEEL